MCKDVFLKGNSSLNLRGVFERGPSNVEEECRRRESASICIRLSALRPGQGEKDWLSLVYVRIKADFNCLVLDHIIQPKILTG